ncbi:MAG: PAS domain S-box protein [Microcoleus sp.]
MCINPTGGDRPLDTCEALVAEQKVKIRQLEEELQQQKELCVNLRTQLKAVDYGCASGSATEFELTEERIGLIASLQKSQEIYRIVIENYPNGWVCLFDRDLRYTLADGQGLAVIGWSTENLEGKTLQEVVPPEDLQLFESKYRAALAGKEHTFEYKYGDRIYSITVVPVKNERSEILAGMVVTQEITEQKQALIGMERLKTALEIKYKKQSAVLNASNQQLREEMIEHWRAEEALRESQQQLELFFSQSLDGFFFMMLDKPVQWDDTVDQEKVLDYVFASGRVTKVNDALLAQYGATREDFICPSLSYFFGDNMTHSREVIKNFFEAGRIHIESESRKFDGTQMWVEGDYICIYDTHGRILGHFGVQRDISGRKKAEAALKESEERFRQLAENIESVFWITDTPKNQTIYISPAYEKIWGRSRADLYAAPKSFLDPIHSEDRDRILAALPKQICGEYDEEYRLVKPDGENRWIRDRAFPITNPTGEVYRIVGIAEDISERKLVEKELQDAKQMYQQILDAITDMILVKGPQSRMIWANKAFRDYYQMENSELIGIVDTEFQEPDYTQQYILDDTSVFNTGQVRQILEEPIKSGDGEVHYFDTIKSPIFNTEGQVVMTVGVSRDTTERKQAEKALRESEERFRQLAENIQDSFWLVSVELTDILYVSPAYEQIWGRSREALYTNNCNWIDWLHPEDKHLLLESFQRIVVGESTSTEYRIVRPDGTIRWVCDRAFPIYDESGKVYRIAGICEDISDRKLTEARIQAALREKEILLKEIHHRVKNNMQVVSSLLQLQAQYIEDETTLSLFEESQNRIHSMALIHEQLYQSENLDRIDLPLYVENLVANVYQSFGCCNSSIQIQLNIDPISLNIETAIPCGLIINELVSNSLKYAFPYSISGEINIKFCEISSQQFHLIIQDNGVGFPADFDVENTETLGIRLVRMLTSQLDGSLTIDSQYGTCYNLVLKELNYRRRI